MLPDLRADTMDRHARSQIELEGGIMRKLIPILAVMLGAALSCVGYIARAGIADRQALEVRIQKSEVDLAETKASNGAEHREMMRVLREIREDVRSLKR
jgi:hypothetical protein